MRYSGERKQNEWWRKIGELHHVDRSARQALRRIPQGSTLKASVASNATKLNITGQWDPPGGPTTNLTHAQVFNQTKKAALAKVGTYQGRVLLVPSSATAQQGTTSFIIEDPNGAEIRSWSETFDLAKTVTRSRSARLC